MKTKQNVLLFDIERGDTISVGYINSVILKAYQKFNRMVPDDVAALTTGQFRGTGPEANLVYPNYCGIMSYDSTLCACGDNGDIYGLIDNLCMKLTREADEIFRIIRGE